MSETLIREASVDAKSLILKTLMVTPSGALSPGPLSAMAVALGAKMGVNAGIAMAFGHMLFEAPYVALLIRGYSSVSRILEKYGRILNALVIAFIAWFSYMLMRDGLRAIIAHSIASASAATATGMLDALIAGVVLTGANAYFLLWWVTVGLPLIRDAAALGPAGFAVMYSAHVWMDYAWLALLAAGGGAAKLLGPEAYGALLIILAILLLIFAADIAARSYAGKRILPI